MLRHIALISCLPPGILPLALAWFWSTSSSEARVTQNRDLPESLLLDDTDWSALMFVFWLKAAC